MLLFMPLVQPLSFALRGYPGLELLALGRLRLEPGERFARGDRQRTKGQTFGYGALDIDPAHPGFFSARRHPYRHVGPGSDLLGFEKVSIHPGEVRLRIIRALDSFEHRPYPKRLVRTGRVVDAGLAPLHHANDPFREVPAIDELHRIARIAGR